MDTPHSTEHWLPVVGYEGIYDVSDEGRIRRVSPTTHGGSASKPGRVLKPILQGNGYMTVNLNMLGRKPKMFTIHRLVLLAFLGADPLRPHCNHKNGVRSDNRLVNLEWCTPSENITHGYHVLGNKAANGATHGSKTKPEAVPRGESHWTRHDANERKERNRLIRELAAQGVHVAEIARRTGVSWSTASRVIGCIKHL